MDFVKNREITAKTVPMPADTVAESFVSAGWLLSQMDSAGGSRAYRYVGGRCVTVGLEAMEFKAPVFVGDEVTIYTEVARQGRTSLALKVEAFAARREGGAERKVTEGVFTFVHIDEAGHPYPIGGHQENSFLAATKSKKASVTDVLDHEPSLLPGQLLSLRTVPFPRDKNGNGDIFGGWVLAQMDLAGFLRARKYAGRVAVPVAINAMTFHRPVSELNEVSFYTRIEETGRTSVTIKVEAWALRNDLRKYERVTEGAFVYVAVDEQRIPVPLERML